jgi:hypothetical protein
MSLAYVYFEDEPDRASGNACCSGGLDSALTGECVGVILSSNARVETHARLIRKARMRAHSTRVRSTNNTSLRMPLKRGRRLFLVVDRNHPSLRGI